MNLIVEKKYFSPNVAMLRIEAPRIAKARRAGNFVIVRADAHYFGSTRGGTIVQKTYCP